MNKIKNLILWFSNFIAKKNRLKIKNTEEKVLLSKENIKEIKYKRDNIKIKEVKTNFKKCNESEIPKFNSEDINYFVSNSSLDRYSLRVIDEWEDGNDCCNFNKGIKMLDLDSLDIFEERELTYFEELERYQEELEDILGFRYKTIEEIGLEGELRVQLELESLDEDEYKIIHNILIPSYNVRQLKLIQ